MAKMQLISNTELEIMQIFDKSISSFWWDKVNFVDSHNTFVGYSTNNICCEDAGWFISEFIFWDGFLNLEDFPTSLIAKEAHLKYPDLHLYYFDPEFFQEVPYRDRLDRPDCGTSVVVFRLIAPERPDLYLHLWNSHNGYYQHGFVFAHAGNLIQESNL